MRLVSPFFSAPLGLLMIARYLCLVSVLRHPEAKEKKGLIDMNCRTFQDALQDVFTRGWDQDKDQETESQGNQTQD